MEIRVLRYFVVVAEEGNISNAAKILNITQPTIRRPTSSEYKLMKK